MTVDPEAKRACHKWLADLWQQTRHPPGEGSAAERTRTIALYATELLVQFPEAAFTETSLRAVRSEWWPSYTTVEDALRQWWHEAEPPAQIEDARLARMSQLDRLWVQFWDKRRSEGFGSVDGRPATSAMTCLGLIHEHSPAAFAYLTQADAGAADVSVRAHWQRDPSTAYPTDEEREYVRARVEEFKANVSTIMARAAEIRGVMPDGTPSGPAEGAVQRPQAVPLAPAVLAAQRAANALVQRALEIQHQEEDREWTPSW